MLLQDKYGVDVKVGDDIVVMTKSGSSNIRKAKLLEIREHRLIFSYEFQEYKGKWENGQYTTTYLGTKTKKSFTYVTSYRGLKGGVYRAWNVIKV